MHKFLWFLDKIFSIFITSLLNLIIKRDANIYLFGLKTKLIKEHFGQNSKYLFLYLQKYHPEIKSVWLCDDKYIRQKMRKAGLKNVYSRSSIQGIWAIIKAGYWFYDFDTAQISRHTNKAINAIMINLWHGAGRLKKVRFDDPQVKPSRIVTFLKPTEKYHLINSEIEIQNRVSAFKIKEKDAIITGSPRLDVLFDEIENAQLFMENDYSNIAKMKKDGKKIIFYTPTFRDTGKNISLWLKSIELQQLLKVNNAVMVCKLHYRDSSLDDTNLNNELYKMDNHSDIYPVLKFSDALISDYSSIAFDYTLLNKPIIYYIPDLKEYTEQCRGFYEPFESQSAGIYSTTEKELLEAISITLQGADPENLKRINLKERLYKYGDNKNCQRVFEFTRRLSE